MIVSKKDAVLRSQGRQTRSYSLSSPGRLSYRGRWPSGARYAVFLVRIAGSSLPTSMVGCPSLVVQSMRRAPRTGRMELGKFADPGQNVSLKNSDHAALTLINALRVNLTASLSRSIRL